MPIPLEAKNTRSVGFLDLPGGGQVVVQGHYAYVGHMQPPHGTSVIDVRDPKHPKLVASLDVPPTIHSHKVRVRDGLMFVNYERFPPPDERIKATVGLKIFDITHPDRPQEIVFYETWGRGVHRFDVDARYAYLSTEWEGYHGNIIMIVDLAEPTRPKEVGRWHLPGQWTAGGERPTWKGKRHRTHHPLRFGDHLYVSVGLAGLAILDIRDLSRPVFVGGTNWHPPYASPTHTVLAVPHAIRDRRWLVVADEDVTDDVWESPPAFLWLVDATDVSSPVPVASFHVRDNGYSAKGKRFGCHQPWERVRSDNLVYVTWFSAGLRIVDISDPYHPTEVASYIPSPVAGETVTQSNDVFVDERGCIYLIDRYRGLEILELSGRT